MTNKQLLRRELLAERLVLSDSEFRLRSLLVQDKIRLILHESTIDFLTVHTYSPLSTQREVNIVPVINWLDGLSPKRTIHTTRKTASGWSTLDWITGSIVAPLVAYDLIIVPMIGFDDRLHRLGYGGGFYDRFLSSQTRAFKLGVCFEQGHIALIPKESHDVPLDMIVTDVVTYE